MMYVLLITLHFLTPWDALELPHPRLYTEEECRKLGPILADWLTQDGVVVTWTCVKIESPSKP